MEGGSPIASKSEIENQKSAMRQGEARSAKRRSLGEVSREADDLSLEATGSVAK